MQKFIQPKSHMIIRDLIEMYAKAKSVTHIEHEGRGWRIALQANIG